MFFGARGRLRKEVVFLALIIPVLLIGSFAYYKVYQEATNAVVAHKVAVTNLMAVSTLDRLDYLAGIADSLASRQQFAQLVEQGLWDEAIAIMSDIPSQFPLIERIFITDLEGTETADTPHRPGAVGSNFSHRDWYKGMMETRGTYVSEVYQRAALPQLKVIAISTPIYGASRQQVGILVMQVKLDSFFDLLQEVREKPQQNPLIIDQRGNVVVSFASNPQHDIRSLAEHEVVQELLQGRSGYVQGSITLGGGQEFIAYQPLEKHGWSVVVAEDASSIFAARSNDLWITLLIFSFFLAFNVLIAYIIIKTLENIIGLRRKEQIFLNSIGDGVVAIDRSWNITLWNTMAEKITGYAADEVMGKPLRDALKFIRETDRKEDMAFIEQAMVTGEIRSTLSEKYFTVAKDGKEVPVSDSAAPLLDANDNVAGVIIVFRDASLEREANQMRSDFTFASHQFRTPLNAALWAVESAREMQRLKDVREHLQTATVSLESIRALVDSLLEMTRLEESKITITPEEVDLRAELDALVSTLDPFAQSKDVIVQYVSDDAQLPVVIDKKMLQRALSEVVTNAIKYSKPQSLVSIDAFVEDSNYTIAVKDTGIGISREDQALIFTKFFRGRNIPAEESGAGLGLYLVKKYIEVLGGKVWFDSEPGKGTVFYIAIPRKYKA